MDRAMEEDLLEVPLTDKVFHFALFFLLALVLFIVGQFAYLNVWKSDFYEARATGNMSDVRIHSAPRGIIFDRFGVPMVENEPSVRVFIFPRDLPSDRGEREVFLENVAKAAKMNFSDLVKRVEEKDWGQSDKLLILDDASHEEVVDLYALNAKGLRIEPSFKRTYKPAQAFSHLIGYTGLVNTEDLAENPSLFIDDKIGRSGLESFYDEYLRGENGKEVFFRNAAGKIEEERSLKESKSGFSLRTFIDAELQEYMYNRLKDGLVSLGRDSGVAIAMNPKNGEVLGIVSVPGFDIKDLKSSLTDPRKPMFNRAVSGLYNPGSTIKPLVALAALTEGVITPEKQIYSAGYIEIPNPYNPSRPSRFLDWQPNGWINVRSALAKSSNIYFYEVTGGFENQPGIGIWKLKEWWQKFGLDIKTGIDISGENKGFLPDPEWKEDRSKDPWRVGDTYNVAIGQGDFSVTPIELLNYVSAIANGGILYYPRIVDIIADESGSPVQKSGPKMIKDISSDISKFIPEVRKGMRDVVAQPYGTAHSLNILPIQVAAKTGTAQIQNNLKVNALFVGYAPYTDPEFSLLILVENAREGSLNTIPVAKDIFLWYYENRLKK